MSYSFITYKVWIAMILSASVFAGAQAYTYEDCVDGECFIDYANKCTSATPVTECAAALHACLGKCQGEPGAPDVEPFAAPANMVTQAKYDTDIATAEKACLDEKRRLRALADTDEPTGSGDARASSVSFGICAPAIAAVVAAAVAAAGY